MLSSLIRGEFTIATAITYLLSSLAVVFLTLPLHEFAHAWTAVRLGDDTPRYQGRLSVNPFRHIDYIGALCIILFGFGWAKPVQINAGNFKSPKRGMAITALAGPVMNLLVALVSLLLANIIHLALAGWAFSFLYYLLSFFVYLADINVYLAVFNLIPIPPLDGSRLLSAALPYKQYYALMRYERYLFIALLAVLWLGILDVPLGFLSDAVYNGLAALAGLPFRLIGG